MTEPALPATSAPPPRHLRTRGGSGSQRTTTVELFFDLVYVFAITQLSHLLIEDLSIGGMAQASFLLVVVWWAWINTTWMTNWFDPTSPAVRTVLSGVMLASLLMAASLPRAFGDDALLFAASYVGLQVGRNAAARTLLGRDRRLGGVFGRLFSWSIASGVLWLAGAILGGDARLLLWGSALALDLALPVAGYWMPGRGRASTSDYDIEGGHFAERCQLFILIALGESIVIAGASAADDGLTAAGVTPLLVAFLETVALWWLYFGSPAEHWRVAVISSDDPGRLARDAYTYVHVLIVGGIVATAAADHLLIADPDAPVHGIGRALLLGGPALFLVGVTLFGWMTTASTNPVRLLAAGLIIGLLPMGHSVPMLALAAFVTALLTALAVWETLRTILPSRTASRTTSRGGPRRPRAGLRRGRAPR